MMHVLWGILNFVLLVFFIRAVCQAVLILHRELSYFTLIILILGVLSYAFRSGRGQAEVAGSWQNKKVAELESSPPEGREVVAEDRLTYSRKVNYFYGKDSLGNRIIAKALWSDTGLSAFTQRRIESFSVHHADFRDTGEPKNSLAGPYYQAYVAEDWNLLGFKVFSNYRMVRGSIPLN